MLPSPGFVAVRVDPFRTNPLFAPHW